MAQTVSRTFGALALLACPATPLAAQQAPTDAPPVPGDATAAPGDGSFDQAPANATQDDRFALDPGLAFEAYVAGNYER
ncbi:MAG: hypothetical protein KI785_15730, partial [Devosiaceae bacterium]|nr:hypothetical protein [Devosiaceae bacterium MH13]